MLTAVLRPWRRPARLWAVLVDLLPDPFVALDTTVVRMVLVPATMELLGRANWWLPAWLDRRLPRLSFEGRPRSEPVPVARPAGRQPVRAGS